MSVEADVFDYVIVGAGAGGCILANRLAADGTKTVCLLEAGPSDNNILLHIPAGIYKTSSNPKYAWQFETEPSPGTANRSIPMVQGKTLGGSTAINGMNYNRGAAADFDEWALQGNRGWGYTDVLPYFKRTERRLGTCDPFYRGTDGLLPITDCDWRHPLCDAFIEAALNAGVPRNPDYNAASQAGVGYYQRYIDKGWRMSAARAFLRPIAKKKNLDVRTNAQATAILFEGRRAVGVRYARGPGHPVREARARSEVILSAGAANSPKLLQLSGVGAADMLSRLGIPVVHELPGVGENVQDHYMIHLIARVDGIETVSGHGAALLREAAKWVLGRPNFLAVSPSLVYGFVNSRDLHSTPDIQLDLALGNYTDHRARRFPVIKLGYYQLRPKSIGYVRAASADPFQAPLIQPNYLDDDQDQQVVVESMKTVQQLLRAPELGRYNCTEELPGPKIADDAERLQFAREIGLTAYHLCGSCRMGPFDGAESVVDDQLRVHGLQGLRVVDASIMPAVPSANTSAAVFMIAEKAADMILGRQSLPALERERPVAPAAAE
ncbi:choline dehydrogenase [Sinorhizobium glycinis]|uniref:Choline dehydrogenase n=1 Tax=Sinorhizobium glycinis TaxID=1472378 RepID=A0A178XXP3_9HYPH|nr:GMC family oxidoreductase N-terminal domain-containing protein [Sinorhizobium glycinis]OAP40017.1 choline dehydrogenase [Sinorhizobium glycinis]